MAEELIPENAEELTNSRVQFEYLIANFTRDYKM